MTPLHPTSLHAVELPEGAGCDASLLAANGLPLEKNYAILGLKQTDLPKKECEDCGTVYYSKERCPECFSMGQPLTGWRLGGVMRYWRK